MRISALLITISLIACYITDEDDGYDSLKTPAELIMSYGYTFEEHKAITPDGYILTLWRIPGSLNKPRNTGPVVLLMHGVLDNSYTYVLKSNKTQNLPYLLADAGYDVWLGNNRGTIRSFEHIDKKGYDWHDSKGKYWDFSVDELGIYDVPTMISYVVACTGHQKINYIGHSQGTAQFFIRCCVNPDFINKHISSYVALGPIIFVNHAEGIVAKLMDKLKVFDILYSLNLKNVWTTHFLLPAQRYLGKLLPNFIEDYIVSEIVGKTKAYRYEITRMPSMVANEPGGTSSQNMLHWAQMLRTGEFKRFDFGEKENLVKYGSTSPPLFDLNNLKERVKIPMDLYAGTKDALLSATDVALSQAYLPNTASVHWVDDYSHLDYVWSTTAYEDIYCHILEFLSKHNN
jgi:pimeloyl-ACP methyl ester carboxylesterase